MRDSQDRPGEPFKDMRETISQGIGLAQAFAMPARVWWTRFGTAGEMFFGGRLSVIGWAIIPIWPVFLAPHDPRPMFGFWGATTLLLIVHRVRHWGLRRRGYLPHSQCGGLSWLEFLGGHTAARRVWEPLLTAICGGVCLRWNEPLGMYLVWASVALVISTGYSYAIDESMLRRLRDAKREQEWLAERIQEEDVG